jgi:hypothetical protein
MFAAHWRHFFDACLTDGAGDLSQRAERLARQIRDNGVTYNVYADEGGPQRPWSLGLFPLIISPQSWQQIESGVAQRVRLRKRDEDGLPMLVSVYPEGVGLSIAGLHGGQAGLAARGVVQDASGAVVHDCGAGELVTLSRTDQFVALTLAGGSGYGDPHLRSAGAVAHDVAMGWISPESALRDYGQVMAKV